MHRWLAPLLLFFFNFFGVDRAEAGPYSALVADVDTNQVFYERNADELRHPASLTKMMTLYLVFDALTKGRLFPDTAFRVSRFAVLRPPSRLGLKSGDFLSVEDGILALVTRSANDAAAVIAEGMAGSESAFAALMTDKASELGMSSTVFRNASGLPDPNQVTTAWDMFRLGRALNKRFPQFYPYFSTDKFYYEGRSFNNHNHLLNTYPGADGIKTGFINSSGFNLVASAKRDGHRLIGVVFGGPSAAARDRHMREILDDGFAQLEGAPPRVHDVPFDRPSPPVLLARPDQDDSSMNSALAGTRWAGRRSAGDGPTPSATRHAARRASAPGNVKAGKHNAPAAHATAARHTRASAKSSATKASSHKVSAKPSGHSAAHGRHETAAKPQHGKNSAAPATTKSAGSSPKKTGAGTTAHSARKPAGSKVVPKGSSK